MASRAAAFAVLGLEPGADRAAIEQAYRRLIKQHHPDREGGDGVRAAEIIHAYRQLRGGRALADPLQFNEIRRRRERRRWPVFVLLAAVAGGLGWLANQYGIPFVIAPAPPAARAAFMPGRHVATDVMEEPLHDSSIDAAIAQAASLYTTKDEIALAAASKECQRRFLSDPSTEMLDRCAAFDNAVIGLQDRDPLRDAGPFAPLEVTGRQWSAASALSSDYLAIDGRLHQIRLRVDLALARRAQAAEPDEPERPAAP